MPFKTNGEYQRNRIRQSDSLITEIHAMLKCYSKKEGTTIDCAIRDALTDIRHLCDVYGLDFAGWDDKAYQGYLEELDYYKEIPA